MNFINFLNEGKIKISQKYDVIRIPKQTNPSIIKRIFDILRKEGKHITDGSELSIINYTKEYIVGVYIYYIKDRIEYDIWRDVDNHMSVYEKKPDYRIAEIDDIIGTKSRYVKQLKWE